MGKKIFSLNMAPFVISGSGLVAEFFTDYDWREKGFSIEITPGNQH